MSEIEDCGGLTRDSHGSAIFSFSKSSTPNSCSNSSLSIKTYLNECSTAWHTYLSTLNNLCAAGSKLAQTIVQLEQYGQFADKAYKMTSEKMTFQNHPSTYLINSWNELGRATAVATGTVKTHITSVLQDFVVLSTVEQTTMTEMEQKRVKDHNELIIMENAQAIINIQHQFCAASCEAFASLTCCFVCQSPVGFPHEQDCTMLRSKFHLDQRSQTSSPNQRCVSTDQKTFAYGTNPGQMVEQVNFYLEQPRGPSPQQNFRDSIPLQAIFENNRGPLPNPGHLLAMKIPVYRNIKSQLNFPLFPLNVQRRWSEAAAGEVVVENYADVESQMRRWSMPWEAWRSDKNTVTWYQTRIMPVTAIKMSNQKTFDSDRSTANTSESNWQSSITSRDGLVEAIQLLSCKPSLAPTYVCQPSETQVLDNEY